MERLIMLKRLLPLLLFLLSTPALAVETWYFRTAAGQACGPGDRESLSQTQGASLATKLLDGTGDTWNVVETRSIAAGNWQVCTDLTVGSGGGPANKVTWLVQRYNSGCVQQGADIINEQSGALSKGATNEYCTAATDPGQVDFAAGDILVVTVKQTNGNQTVTLRYNSTGDADSRVTHPDEAAAGGRHAIVVH